MTAAFDYEHLHHIVDRLPPEEARRLLVLVETDSQLSSFATEPDDEDPEGGAAQPLGTRTLSFAGIGDSGRADLSERHRELVRDEFGTGE